MRIHRGQSVGALFTSEVHFTQEMLLWDVDSQTDRRIGERDNGRTDEPAEPARPIDVSGR